MLFRSSRLGGIEAATNELKKYLGEYEKGRTNHWQCNIGDFLAGRLQEQDFLKAAESGDRFTRKQHRCEAYCYAGAMQLISGDRAHAQECFKKCVETRLRDFTEFRTAMAELDQLTQAHRP